MRTVALNNGTRIPWLAFGTGTALYGRDATESVRVAIDNGITHLDGAQMYKNEDSLGAGIKASGKKRSDLYIVTKLDKLEAGQTVKESLEASLKKLGLDFVDLFLVHSPLFARREGKLKELWQAMEETHEAGLAKSIGVSNFTVEDLEAILPGAKVIPAVNQIELHPYIWKAAQPIVDLGQKHGIVTASYGGQTPIVRAAGGPADGVISTIRERLEKSTGQPVTSGQVLNKWIVQKGAIVVTTTSKVSRIKEAIATENVPDLTPEEMSALDNAGSLLHKRTYMRDIFGE